MQKYTENKQGKTFCKACRNSLAVIAFGSFATQYIFHPFIIMSTRNLVTPYLPQGIADASQNETINTMQFFFSMFGEICSMYEFHCSSLDEKVIDVLHQKYSTESYYYRFESVYEETHDTEINRNSFFALLKQDLMLESKPNVIVIYYVKDKNDQEAEILKQLIRPFLINTDADDKTCQAFLIVNNGYDFRLMKMGLKLIDVDVPTFYNDDFMPIHEVISNNLKKESIGLIILHGLPGTGKTSYLRYLIKTISNRFIYIPSELMEILARPTFLPFLSSYAGSILILEDCEVLLKQRHVNGQLNPALVSILNMTDGLLGDGLQLKIICTFNAPVKDIDQALLRKGRLIAKYDFRKLEAEKVNRLVIKQNLDIPHVETPMSLSEIFNYKDKSFEQESTNRIGFN